MDLQACASLHTGQFTTCTRTLNVELVGSPVHTCKSVGFLKEHILTAQALEGTSLWGPATAGVALGYMLSICEHKTYAAIWADLRRHNVPMLSTADLLSTDRN